MLLTSLIFAQAQETSLITTLQEKFIAGGDFMWPILLSLIIGIAFSIAKSVTLLRASQNTKKFVIKVTETINNEGIQAAMQLCQNTRGPVASVFHAGILRADEGLEAAEKAIMTYGSLEMNFLEKGMVWLSFCISIAPMLGFTGTVQGMIQAFDAIAASNTMSPAVVATGIAVALLTTIFGLMVAMLLQFFFNFFISRIDKLVGDMEQASIELIDVLYDYQKKNKK
ncbi:MAG: MotA/TolQ/ExbB proton channel family protein [Bacteroidia bacterium]|nr:MotA/TolQ/ExbB proton channel family protein [Bacteroidia bacterium]